MNTGIPGLDVIEGFPLDGSPEATAARNAAQARASLRMAPTAAPAQPGSMFRRAMTASADGLKGVAGAVKNAPGILDADVGTTAGKTLRGVGSAARGLASTVVNGAGRALLPLAAAEGARESYGTSTEDMANRMGIDPTASVVPQAMKDVGIRALGTLQNVGNVATGGLADRFGNLIAGNGFNRSEDPASLRTSATQPTASTPDVPTDLRNIMPPQASSLTPTDSLRGGITRVGNSFTDGSANPSKSGYGVSTVPGGPTATNADVMAAAKTADAFGPGAHTADGSGGLAMIGDSRTAERNASWNRDRAMYQADHMRDPRAAAGLRTAVLGSESQDRATAAANQTAQLQNSSALRIAQLHDATQRRSNDQTTAVALAGHEMTLRGHRMSNDVAVAQAQRKQFNDDRTFSAGRYDADNAQKTARENALQKNIEAVNVGPDNKVDAAAAGDYRRGIDRSVARMGAAGVHQLSPLDEQRLYAGSDLLKTMKSNANWLPWNPDKLNTVDPVDLTNLRILPNGDRQITRADSKAAGQTIPKRFFDTEEGTRFFGGTPTNKYDMLHEGKQ